LGKAKAEVLLSCLEFIEPHPDQAVEILAGKGLNEVVIMPYLLGQGKHATDELEEVLDDVKRRTPQVKPRLAGGFGSDGRLADLVVDRVRDLDGTPGVAPSQGQTVGVLIVKAGTKTQYDDCAWLRELGRMVERQLEPGYAVDVAQSHYGDPTMESASARLVEERGASVLVCVPYVFFPGMILRRNVLGGMTAAQEKYPHIPMHVTPPLGVDDRVVAVAADRIREVWGR
jgi:sirohydrochlorin ferrochelatase